MMHSTLILLALFWSCVLCSSLEIDWENCGEDKNCYVLGTCKSNSNFPEKLESYENGEEIANKECEIVMTVKPFSVNKYLFTIRVRGKELTTKKLGLYQGDSNEIISCEEDNGVMKVALVDQDPKFELMKLNLYEDLSYFGTVESVCAFTVVNPTLLSNHKRTFATTIKFDEVKYEYKKIGTEMYAVLHDRIRCDPDSIQDMSEKHDYLVLPIKHRARMSLDCANYKSELGLPYDYRLFVQIGDDEAFPVNKFQCEEKTFMYYNGSETEGNQITDSFSAFCALDLSKTCTKPPNCEGMCPDWTGGDNTNDATLKCPESKWFIDDTYYVGIETSCGRNHENKAVFTMTYPDGKRKELEGGERCFEKYDCMTKSKLDLIQCEKNATDCGSVVAKDGQIYCQDPNRVLMVFSGSQKLEETPGFQCDIDTGDYKNGSIIVPLGARITCTNRPLKEDPLLSAGAVEKISVGASVGALLVALAISAVIYFAIRCKNRYRGALNKEVFKLTNPSSRRAQALDTFGKASVARPDQDVTILDALKLLDAIIECEMEDHEVWVAIDTFLKRFHAVAFSVDYQVERFLNRYCYLQAKKIIDKHGWICSTPITKSNPTGLIRTCAIRLLTVARRDDPDAQNLILDGFKKLQFNGIDQYPHCGQLWSLVAQQRVGSVDLQDEFIERLVAIVHDRENETEEEKRAAMDDPELMNKRKYGILKDDRIPEENRFPEFGSIKNQCCFAMGSCDISEVWLQSTDVMLHPENEDWASLSLSILNGIFSASSGNTYVTLLELLNCRLANDETENKLYGILFPSPAAVEPIMTALIFNRRFLDAKEREHRYERRQKREKRRIEREEMEKKEEREEEMKEGDLDNSENREKRRAKKEEYRRRREREMEEDDEDGRRGPSPIYDKLKEMHRLFIASFHTEKDDILAWLSGKIGREEVKSQSKKESERITSQSNSSHSNSLQIIDPNGKTKDQLFVEKFVSEFHKSSNVKRVTKSLLTEEEKIKYRSILDQILGTQCVLGLRIHFRAEDVVDICKKMVEVCRTEPVLIEDVPMGITVVTDLHGQIYDLVRIFNANAVDGKPGHEATRYLFTGDYVDRGDKALEVVMALFILKILNPDRFFVLRGNHEFKSVNFHYGFMEEIFTRYDEGVGEYIYNTINESFMFLSLCAIVGDEIFCVHGGISAGSFTRHELRMLRKPIAIPREDTLVEDMTWSDPAKSIGYFDNPDRGGTNYFGEDVLLNGLDRIECTGMLRGHSCLKSGYHKLWPSCIALFTATAVDYRVNDGAVVRLFEDNTYQVVVLKYDMERERTERRYYGQRALDTATNRQIGGEINPRDE